MPARTSLSPSPPPQAPIASAPGPRAVALTKVFAGALSSSIKANTYANFSSCFPTPARYCPTALEGVWKQLNKRLEEECTRDFEKILEERQVAEGLNQWDAMVEDARRRMNRSVDGEILGRAPHTLSADELYTAHLTPYLQQASRELNLKIQHNQQENSQAMEKITQQRVEIEQLVHGLETILKDIEDSVDAMNSGMDQGVDGLRKDVWETEQELTATRGTPAL